MWSWRAGRRRRQESGREVGVTEGFGGRTVAALAAALEGRQGEVRGGQEVRRRERGATEAVPLSYEQERLWFLYEMEPDSDLYNVTKDYHLSGPLDVAALRDSLRRLLARHQVLRTTFRATAAAVQQAIVAAGAPAFTEV